MPTRAPKQQAAPAEVINNFTLGYNGYTDPTLTNPRMWAASQNVITGAFGYIQRARFANVVGTHSTGLPYTSMKYFALPGIGSYLLADQNGKLYSYETVLYSEVQRINPYVDPTGAGSSSLNGPWAREFIQNIVYEMNGTVKQCGRNANALTVEGFGIDAPDASPQVVVSAGSSQNVAAPGISRSNGTVTAVLAAALTVPGGNGVGMVNVVGVSDTSFNGTFVVLTGSGTATLTWAQTGQNVATFISGSVNTSITKTVGRSYQWAWENANKPHVSAPSPSTQYILYATQNGAVQLIEQGTVSMSVGSNTVTGVGTAFTSAWIGRTLWVNGFGNGSSNTNMRIVSVAGPTSMSVSNYTGGNNNNQPFQVFDPQSTHIRLYQTGDGQATYFRTQRNAFLPAQTSLTASGLQFFDNANSEPPAFPYTTETSQLYNLPPPIGSFIKNYQGVLCVFGVAGALQSFFYSNQTVTSIGMQQESFAPLNQITLPIQNAQINGMLEFPGSLIVWSDKQDMYRLSGLLTDNVVSTTTPSQQGATITKLPYTLGCAGPYACATTPLGGMWLTPNNELWLYTDRYAPRNIGRPVQDLLSNIPNASLSTARMAYFHGTNRNWLVLAIPANGTTYNSRVLVLDLDLLASNGSPSYFVFDMATNSPSYYLLSPFSPSFNSGNPRADCLEVVIETRTGGNTTRLFAGQIDLLQDIDYLSSGLGTGGTGVEVASVPGSVTLHAWGNDSPFSVKRPAWLRFVTNDMPNQLTTHGWAFSATGYDDDFYPLAGTGLALALTPGTNDTATLGGNPDFYTSGSPFRTSQDLYRVGGVNFVMGRRIQYGVTFPTSAGFWQFRQIQVGFGATPPD